MDIKEILKQYYWLSKEIEALQENLETLCIQAESVQSTRITGLPTSHNTADQIAANLAKIEALKDYYQVKLGQKLEQQQQIERLLDTLPEREQLLMRYRYMDGLEWEQVADRMHYSWQWMHKVHAKALKQLNAKQLTQQQEAIQSEPQI